MEIDFTYSQLSEDEIAQDIERYKARKAEENKPPQWNYISSYSQIYG